MATMTMDKIASSPVLPCADGWIDEPQISTLPVMGGIATPEESQDRHTIADLTSSVPDIINPIVRLPRELSEVMSEPQFQGSCSALESHLEGSPSMSRLEPLTQASGDIRCNEGGESDDSEDRSHSSNKVASFWIGDDQGCTTELPQAPPEPPIPPTNRRVQISDQQEKVKKPAEFTPPDGGYGWVVALSACMVNVWIVGFIKSYGVLYVHFREAFPEASAYHASWLPALLATIGLLIAPMTGMLCRSFTSRKVSFAGGILCFLGLLLGSVSVSMNQVIMSVGVLTGLGAGLTTTPGVLIVSLYFEKRRALASAICVSGNALGGFFMPPLVDYLLELYGIKGTMFILAAMQLHICAASLLYRPIHQHAIIQAHERSKLQKMPEYSENQVPVPEYNKLLPNTPATPQTSLPLPASAPGTPLARSHAIWQKVVRKRLSSTTTVEDEELRRQVSFLRSTSMMNSIPDLTQYARSWSISGERASMGSRSSIRMAMGSKSSLSRLSTGTSSKSSLTKLAMAGENKHQALLRLTSDESQKIAKHPTLVRLTSEEEGIPSSGGIPKNLSGSFRTSQSRLNTDVIRTQLGRQSSCRRVQGRIMSAVKEQDNDSQISDETEDFVNKPTDENTEYKPEDASIFETKEKVVMPAQDEEKKQNEEDEDTDDDNETTDGGPGCCQAFMMSCFDISLFKNPLFVMMSLSVFFMASGAPHAIFFLPAYAESVDIPSTKIPHMLSISSMVDLVGRLGIGFISDLNLCKISYIYFISGVVSGLAVLLVPQMTSFASLSAVLGMYGFGVGAWFVLIPTILARHHGAAHLASSYGLVRLFHGLMNFISPQINGLLVDSTDSFVYCYYFMGTAMVISAVLLLSEPFLVNYVESKEKMKQQLTSANSNQV